MPNPRLPVLSLVAALASLLLAGCVEPSFSKVPINGKVITRGQSDLIVPGKTTRAEVVKTLGSGFQESLRMPALGYSWEMRVWTVLFWDTLRAGGEPSWEYTRWHAFFVAFDQRGVVTRKQFVNLSYQHTFEEHLAKWAAGR